MRTLIAVSLLVATYLAADSPDAEILRAEENFAAAWNKRDADAMAKLITDDFIQIARTNNLYTRQKFLDGLKAGQYSTGVEKFQKRADYLVRVYGNAAVVTFSREGLWGPRDGKQVPTLHRSTHVSQP